MSHGTRGCYVRGCRRDECREANRQYLREYAAVAKTYWPHTPDVDPGRTVAHIAALRAAGMGFGAIAHAAGMNKHGVREIALGRRVRGIRPDTERRILAVTPHPSWVDATGARRRLQALMALGHTSRAIAAHAGFTHRTVSAISTGQATVTRAVHEAVVEVYERLSMTPGTSDIGRRRAAASGWPPPLAWDDDTIDDPAARPAVEDPLGESSEDRLDEWVFLVRSGEDRRHAAHRVGWASLNTVDINARRHGRLDVLHLLQQVAA